MESKLRFAKEGYTKRSQQAETRLAAKDSELAESLNRRAQLEAETRQAKRLLEEIGRECHESAAEDDRILSELLKEYRMKS